MAAAKAPDTADFTRAEAQRYRDECLAELEALTVVEPEAREKLRGIIVGVITLTGLGLKFSDIAIQAREIVKARERIARTIARETGKPLETAGVKAAIADAEARLAGVGRLLVRPSGLFGRGRAVRA